MHTEMNTNDQTDSETNVSSAIEANSRVGSGSNAREMAVSPKGNDRMAFAFGASQPIVILPYFVFQAGMQRTVQYCDQ